MFPEKRPLNFQKALSHNIEDEKKEQTQPTYVYLISTPSYISTYISRHFHSTSMLLMKSLSVSTFVFMSLSICTIFPGLPSPPAVPFGPCRENKNLSFNYIVLISEVAVYTMLLGQELTKTPSKPSGPGFPCVPSIPWKKAILNSANSKKLKLEKRNMIIRQEAQSQRLVFTLRHRRHVGGRKQKISYRVFSLTWSVTLFFG